MYCFDFITPSVLMSCIMPEIGQGKELCLLVKLVSIAQRYTIDQEVFAVKTFSLVGCSNEY